jgi:hypothetical protein
VNNDLRAAFLQDVADTVRYWNDFARSVLAGTLDRTLEELALGEKFGAWERLRLRLADDQHRQDFDQVMHDCLSGLAHSFLAILDGATKLSNDGRCVFLTD